MVGVAKEKMRMEVEISRYLMIRTEVVDESREPTRKFERNFRLLGRVYLNGISIGYEDGVLTVTVPRSITRDFYIDLADVFENLEVLARAS